LEKQSSCATHGNKIVPCAIPNFVPVFFAPKRDWRSAYTGMHRIIMNEFSTEANCYMVFSASNLFLKTYKFDDKQFHKHNEN
jgi:hypothetical protein